jgi:hypothetical protein
LGLAGPGALDALDAARFRGQTQGVGTPWAKRLLLLVVLACARSESRASESSWPVTLSVHFVIHYESQAPPLEFQTAAEAAHRKVVGELSSMVSWLITEKIHIYVYRDRRGYEAGKFKPAEWSEAAAHYGARGPKSIAVVEGVSAATFAHELSHLVLGSFFMERRRTPPRWLDEGLAGVMEWEIEEGVRIETGPRVLNPQPLEAFMAAAPGENGQRIGPWYWQAESLVRFLMRARSPFNFNRFCRELRDGESVPRALFSTYALRTLDDLDKAWKDWMSTARIRPMAGAKMQVLEGLFSRFFPNVAHPKRSSPRSGAKVEIPPMLKPEPLEPSEAEEPALHSSGTVRLLR